MRTIITAGLALALASVAQAEPRRPAASPDRWRARDLNGLWSSRSLTAMERPKELTTLTPSESEVKSYEERYAEGQGRPDEIGSNETDWWDTGPTLARIRGRPRASWIVSPADGRRPFSAAAKARRQRVAESRKLADGPEALNGYERCLLSFDAGPPLTNSWYNDNFQFVQTGAELVIHAEDLHEARVVRMGEARHAPNAVRRWAGDSIGHWEGDTLVVETTNFAPAQIGAPPGDTTRDMKVVERFTRTARDELFYEFSVTDPAQFVQTWRGEMVLHATKGPIYEVACHEGNYALENMLRGARRAETQASSGSNQGAP